MKHHDIAYKVSAAIRHWLKKGWKEKLKVLVDTPTTWGLIILHSWASDEFKDEVRRLDFCKMLVNEVCDRVHLDVPP